MARFQFQARDSRGQVASGALVATSLEEASKQLRAQGKFIVKLSESRDAGPSADATPAPTQSTTKPAPRGRGGVKREEVILFAQQLAVMVETGVPISEALECAATQAQTPQFSAVLKEVATAVQAGQPLSVALARHGGVFPPVMISLVKASEISGTMGPMLERVAGYLNKELATLRQVRGAMTYPAFMFGMSVCVTGFLLTFVLPKFAVIYQGKGATLPGPTRFLLGLSDGLTEYWYLWLLGLAAIIGGAVLSQRTARGRYALDWLKLHAPIFKHLFTQLYVSRSCRTMGTMLAAGVSVLDMVAVVREVTPNALYQKMWDDVDQRLRQGAQLSDPLAASGLMPKSVTQMIKSGEKSGRMGPVLARVSEFTEQEFDRAVKQATQFIEPVMVAAMGLLVGFVAIALLLPIFNVGRVMAGDGGGGGG